MMVKRCTAAPAVVLELYDGKDPKPYIVSQSLAVQFLEPSKLYVAATDPPRFDIYLLQWRSIAVGEHHRSRQREDSHDVL